MTSDEGEALLGPELCAELRAKWGPPKRLSPEQIALLTELLSFDVDEPAQSDVA